MFNFINKHYNLLLACICIVLFFDSCADLHHMSKAKIFSPIITIDSIEDVKVAHSALISGKLTDKNNSSLKDQEIYIRCASESYTATTNSLGDWSLTTSPFSHVGIIEVYASYFYDEGKNVNATAYFKVLQEGSDPSYSQSILSINPIEDIYYGQSVSIEGVLKDSSDNPLVDKTVHISINGASHSAVTNSSGVYSFETSPLTPAGSWVVEVKYYYTQQSFINATTNFNVLKIDPQMTIDNDPAEEREWTNVEQCVWFDINLPVDVSGTISIVTKHSSGNTVHQLNNISITEGLASGQSCATAPGTYSSTISYSGDSKYKSVSDTVQTFSIVPVPTSIVVTISEHTDNMDYDGEEHCISGYDVDIFDTSGLYQESDFSFSGNDSVCGTDAGTYDMELEASDFTNTNPNFSNVSFVITDGQLVIDPISVTVTITEHSGEIDYDGEEHTVEGYDVDFSNPLYTDSDYIFSGNDSASGTNAGIYDMELSSLDFENQNPNFSDVIFEIVDGQLVITPIDVTVDITGNNNSSVYDGEEHCTQDYDVVSISNPLYEESDFNFIGSSQACRTNAGTSNMNLAPNQFSNTNSNFATVTFNITDGYQTITSLTGVTVTITEHSDSVSYDGSEHCISGYDIEINEVLYQESDFTFSGNSQVCATNAGYYDMNLSSSDFSNTNSNFSNVNFVIVDGQLVIQN